MSKIATCKNINIQNDIAAKFYVFLGQKNYFELENLFDKNASCFYVVINYLNNKNWHILTKISELRQKTIKAHTVKLKFKNKHIKPNLFIF